MKMEILQAQIKKKRTAWHFTNRLTPPWFYRATWHLELTFSPIVEFGDEIQLRNPILSFGFRCMVILFQGKVGAENRALKKRHYRTQITTNTL
jgi:hypothetical protein